MLHTLRGHKGRVNAVAWIPSSSPTTPWRIAETELVSASSDNMLITWKMASNTVRSPHLVCVCLLYCPKWQATAVLKGHTDPVISVVTLVWPDDIPEVTFSSVAHPHSSPEGLRAVAGIHVLGPDPQNLEENAEGRVVAVSEPDLHSQYYALRCFCSASCVTSCCSSCYWRSRQHDPLVRE